MFNFMNNKRDYSGIDYAMKDIPPIPLSPRQRTNLAKIKPYPFIMIAVVYLIFIGIAVIDRSTDILPYMLKRQAAVEQLSTYIHSKRLCGKHLSCKGRKNVQGEIL